MFVVETVDQLWNHIAYTRVYAPNDFPVEDFLAPKDQMNLERAFKLLRDGIKVAYPEDEYSEKRQHLNAILDKSYAQYKDGDEIAAGHLLNEFQDEIFQTED